MTDNVTPLPENVVFDLDAEERPAEEVKPDFTVRINGRVLTMTDPEEIDWQDLLDIENPVDFLHYCTSQEDREFLYAQRMGGWKLGRLMDRYMKHFELDAKMQQFKRQQRRGGA